MGETNKQKLNRLYQQNNLTNDDVFKHKLGYSIITRTGIEKIQANHDLQVNYDLLKVSEDHESCIVKATAVMRKEDGDVLTVESFGEATPKNNRMAYPIAMAEKRALSRVVLKATGFYALGAYGEDEADDFRNKQGSTPAIKPQPTTDTKEYNFDEIIKQTEVKLKGKKANPIAVKKWFDERTLTDEQRKAVEKLLEPYV